MPPPPKKKPCHACCRTRFPKSSSCPDLNNTATLNGHQSRQTANIPVYNDKCNYSHQMAMLPHDNLSKCYLPKLENPKLLLEGTAVFPTGLVALVWVSICGSLAHHSQALVVLCPFPMCRETESWPIMHTHQRGHGLLWKSTDFSTLHCRWIHTNIQTNTQHTISHSFLF